MENYSLASTDNTELEDFEQFVILKFEEVTITSYMKFKAKEG